MRIATRLGVMVLLPVLLVAAVAALQGWGAWRLEETLAEERRVLELERRAQTLGERLSELLRHPAEPRPRLQLSDGYRTLAAAIEAVRPLCPAGEASPIDRHYRQLGLYYQQLLAEAASPTAEDDAVARERRHWVADRLLLASQRLVHEARLLARRKADEHDALHHLIDRLLLLLAAVVAVVAAAVGLFMARRIGPPLAALRRGVEIVAAGELDHRIGGPCRDEIGELGCAFDTMTGRLREARRRIAEEMAATARSEREVRELQRQIEFILGATRTGLDVIDREFNLRYVDAEWSKRYGPWRGRKCYDYFAGRDRPCPGCAIPAALAGCRAVVSEERLPKEGGRPIQITSIPFQGDGGEWLVAEVNVDISERKHHEQELFQQANYDALTGLPNRSLAADRLEQAVVEARRGGRRAALLFIDLDNFKGINDTLGHEAGDRYLVAVALRLRACVRAADTVARLGGDEFLILLPRIGEPADIRRVCDEILRAMAEPIALAGRELTAGVSIGIALYPDDGDNADLLLRSADRAMYRAKAAGRNTYR